MMTYQYHYDLYQNIMGNIYSFFSSFSGSVKDTSSTLLNFKSAYGSSVCAVRNVLSLCEGLHADVQSRQSCQISSRHNTTLHQEIHQPQILQAFPVHVSSHCTSLNPIQRRTTPLLRPPWSGF